MRNTIKENLFKNLYKNLSDASKYLTAEEISNLGELSDEEFEFYKKCIEIISFIDLLNIDDEISSEEFNRDKGE